MNARIERRATVTTWALILLPALIFLAPALRPGFILLPASLPYWVDPLWQSIVPPTSVAQANPILSDQIYQYHPWKVTLWQSLAQGELPWWTPAVNGGQPLLANSQVGLFDPFNLLGMLFPLASSYVVGAILRLWVAGGFTYLYARSIGLSRLAAWLTLLVFSFSGPLVSWLNATPTHVLVWLPALLWVGEKRLATRHLGWGLAASGLLALLLFSSQPEVAFQVGLFWGIYLLIRATWREGGLLPGLRRHAQGWLWIALLGIALAAVEVLPFVDVLRQSVVFNHRSVSNPLDFTLWLRHLVASWQEWPTLITILLPNFLGSEQNESYWYPTGNSIENNAYAGVLPLLLALLALWAAWRNKDRTQRRWVWLWGGLGMGALALAVELPLFKGINDLPPFNLVFPGRLRAIYVFAVAILAGFGLDFLLANQTSNKAVRNALGNRTQRTLLLLVTGAAAINILLVTAAYLGFTHFAEQLITSGRAFMEANVGSPTLDRPLAELYTLVEKRQQAKISMLRPSNPIMYLPVWVAGMVALLLWLHHKGRITMAIVASAFIAITWFDLLWVGAGFNTAVPATWLETTPPAVEYLQRQPGVFRVVGTHLILNPNMSMLTQLEDVRGYDPMEVNRYRELLAGLDGYAPVGYHNYFRHLDDPRLDLFNATYGLSRTRPSDPRWEPLFGGLNGVTVYRSHTALPRAYLVYAADIVESQEQSLARTLNPGFDPRQSVVLEDTPEGWRPPANPPREAPQVEFIERQANTLQLETNTPLPALLVLLDTYAPGWSATIDQQPTSIYPANHAFRAVVVPAGRHRVSFTYAPPLLTVGVAISAGALVVLLGLFLWERYSEHMRARLR